MQMNLGQLNVSVEDRFVILQLNVENDLLPHGGTLERFSRILNSLRNDYQVICDFREVKHITNDLEEFIEEFEFFDSKLLVDEDKVDFFKRSVSSKIEIFPVTECTTKFKETSLDLRLFSDGHSRDLYYKDFYEALDTYGNRFPGLPSKEEYELFVQLDGLDINNKPYYKNYEDYQYFCNMSTIKIQLGVDIVLSRRYLVDLLQSIGRKSILSQLCIVPNGKTGFQTSFFQANSINEIKYGNSTTLGRPFVYSGNSNKLFYSALSEFQALLNNKKVSEYKIQTFLEKHPFFIEALGYRSIQPQVILERDDGTSMKPDFMVQPIGEDWWDILDIKLPEKKTFITSQRDRYRFSSSVTELQAQLREYAAYFEEEKYAKRIEEKYGIKCYKPRLIGVFGRDFEVNDDRQVRRTMTSYSDAKILTFDQLYRIAKERLLI